MPEDRMLMRYTCCLALTLLSTGSLADTWACQQAGMVREVTIDYPNAPEPLPCEVFYTKSTENALPRALWSASNEPGYCERKAAQFVEKLRALGWQCSSGADQ